MKTKRRLTPEEMSEAVALFKQKNSLRMIAKKMGVNKPALLKSLDLWDSESKRTDVGRKYRLVRGKAVFAPAV